MKLKTDNIFQVIEIKSTPEKVYDALMNEKSLAAFTQMKAKVENKIGGHFEVTDGESFGYNVYLKENKTIVQAWSHKSFPEGFYSVVHIDLVFEEGVTVLNFNHLGVPEQDSGWLTEGWKRIYWEPLKRTLEV
ncbi:MAG: SRPBCC domain-containing protein [Flavobacteriales bacterium]